MREGARHLVLATCGEMRAERQSRLRRLYYSSRHSAARGQTGHIVPLAKSMREDLTINNYSVAALQTLGKTRAKKIVHDRSY
jgi:hypothetical protein